MNKAKTKAVITNICLIIMLVISMYCLHESHTEKAYGIDAVVTATYDCGSIHKVYVRDDTSMAYSFYGNGYQVDQSVRLIMSNNATPDRYDDIVTGAVTL